MNEKYEKISVGDLIIPTDEYLLERKKYLNSEDKLGCIGVVIDVSLKRGWIKAYFGILPSFEVLRFDEIDIVLYMDEGKEKN